MLTIRSGGKGGAKRGVTNDLVAGERDKWALGSRNEIQASLVLLVSLFIVAPLVPLIVVTTGIRPRSKLPVHLCRLFMVGSSMLGLSNLLPARLFTQVTGLS